MHPLDNEFITIGNLLTEYRRRFGKEIDLLNLLFSDFNIDLFIFISYENRKVYFTKKKDKYIPRVNFSFDFFYLSENRDVYIEYYSEVDDFSYDEIDITIKNKLYFYENLNLSANSVTADRKCTRL
ncbi:hypothetical protein ACLSZC_07890, partial [Avibacterium avium]|uniref:hypothetical protein n=1 Tax=Avibacterium avium TaxID=751 RepID=UPI003BF796B8